MSLALVRSGLRQVSQQLDAIEAPPELSVVQERERWIYPEYYGDPEGFCREVLGDDVTERQVLAGQAPAATAPWAKQVDILESVRDHQRTVVPASHAGGKTWTAARAALWFLYTRAPGIVITTAPKATQVRDLLWGRLRAAWGQTRKPLHGECLLTRLEPIRFDPEWYAVGYTARDAEGFQGYHEAELLVIFDEAPGVPAWIWDAMEGMMSTEGARFLAIGNPTTRSGHFYRACTSSLYNRIHMSAWDHPNVVHGRAVYPKAVAPKWPQERLDDWGELDPRYVSRVKGEFPDAGEDTLIPLSWVEAAVDREVSTDGEKIISPDVARFGMDETVFYLLLGRLFDCLETYVGKDTVSTAGRLVRWYRSKMADRLVIDDDGVGGGVTDQVKAELRKQGREHVRNVVAFQNGGTAKNTDDFANRGTEAWWLFRLACEESYQFPDDPSKGVSLPNDPVLISQLASRHFDYTGTGQIILESKKDLRKQKEPSPDRADGVVMAWWSRVYRPPRVISKRVKA